MKFHRIILIFVLQLVFSGAAYAWPSIFDAEQVVPDRSTQCESYWVIPSQSEEGEKKEEEEPDCE